MAIKLIANYSKRLGLPGYSSHQFSVSVETELMTTDDVATVSTSTSFTIRSIPYASDWKLGRLARYRRFRIDPCYARKGWACIPPRRP